MKAHDGYPSVTRRAFLSAGALACIACVTPQAVFASDETVPGQLLANGRISVQRSGACVRVSDVLTGETGHVSFSDNGETARITYSDGSVSNVSHQSDGTVAIDGAPVQELEAAPARASVPAGFTLLSSTRYDFTGMSVVNAILFFVSLGMGNAPAVVQFLVNLMGGTASLMPDGYMELDQYVNYSTNKFFNVYRFYDKYGNYQYETTTGPF